MSTAVDWGKYCWGKTGGHGYKVLRELLLVVVFGCSVISDYLQSHGLQHARLPCPSPSPGACSNSCPLIPWCHPTASCSVIPFSSCLQSFPISGSILMSQLFASGGQITGVSASASILPMNLLWVRKDRPYIKCSYCKKDKTAMNILFTCSFISFWWTPRSGIYWP